MLTIYAIFCSGLINGLLCWKKMKDMERENERKKFEKANGVIRLEDYRQRKGA